MESMLRGGRPPTPAITNDLFTEVGTDGGDLTTVLSSERDVPKTPASGSEKPQTPVSGGVNLAEEEPTVVKPIRGF